MKPTPNVDLAHEVIESIVSLTEQRDRRSLEQSLMTTLEEMLHSVEGWLLDLPQPNSRDPGCNMLHGDLTSLPQGLIERSRDLPAELLIHLIDQDGLTYLLAKLQDVEQDRYHLLILAGRQWDEGGLQLVRGMIRVYQNFVGVLYDSEKDTLTGLYNRRKLDAKLKDLATARLQGRRQADKDHGDYLALLDLDHFKQINDGFGHLIGDEVLLVFANILRKTLRDSDLIFRYGGEEFVILLQDVSDSVGREVLERIRRNVERHTFPQVGSVTVSIGYACLENGTLPIQIMARADKALYYAKENGRNQVCDFGRLLAEGKVEDRLPMGSIELF
jgi:diguanylate cyclase (GGDEF)-like protein